MNQISGSVLARELGKRKLRKELVLDTRYSAQNAFIQDSNRFVAAQCSRRAGKTTGLIYRFAKTLERHPGSQCIYLALTRESAKDIMWNALIEVSEQHNLGWTFTESKLEMRCPNGASLKLYGADQKNFIKRLKGRKYPGIAIDEAQDFGVHLRSLIDDVLTPSTIDYVDGWIALTGTPGPVPQGYFFEVTESGRYGYSLHKWTVNENPAIRDAEAFIQELKLKQEWDDRNPTLLREWRNQWVLDVQSLWVQYKESLNDYKTLPTVKWNYILGIDLGYKDADAMAVLAWSEADPCTYLVEEQTIRGQGITELAEQVNALTKKYDIAKMVIDQGGLGLKIAEEMRRRFHIPVIGAEKQRKQEAVKFLNDTMRQGRFKAMASSQFAQDSYLIQIDYEKTTPDRIVIKKNYHSDIIDAVLYAFRESPAFTYQKPKPVPKANTPEYFDAETSAMEEAAEAYFAEQAEKESDYTEWV